MSNKYYKTGDERAALVADLFAVIARRYDLINDLQSLGLHRHWKKRVAKLAGLKPGDKALDVCCGTGDISFALRREGAAVIGLDFSEGMLEVAREREKNWANSSNGTHIAFQQGDAMELPFEPGKFDAVTVGYGLRNLESWERGVEEMVRVARSGGRILILDFGKPDNALWRAMFYFYLRTVVPLLGKLLCRDAAALAYIYESLLAYPAQRGVAEKLSRLGCREVKIRNAMGGAMSIHSGIKS